jgi:hypothetical protein
MKPGYNVVYTNMQMYTYYKLYNLDTIFTITNYIIEFDKHNNLVPDLFPVSSIHFLIPCDNPAII